MRERCLVLPDVTEGLTRGAPSFAKFIAKFIDPEDHPRFDWHHIAFSAAAPLGARQELVAADPGRFFVSPFGGSHWAGMRLDVESCGPDWNEAGEILTEAYRQVAPKALIALLDDRQ
ncbi:MAG: MmcQ/YjbR family DNA-binding protein [Egibacteraceae bacterium]